MSLDKQRRHKLDLIMRLQVGGHVGDQGVSGRMRFVETVARELLDQPEQFGSLLLRHALGVGALDELLAELGDGLELLLADRLDATVGVGQLDAAQAIEDSHHLLLVDHHAVGLFQDLFHHRVFVLGLLPAVLHLDVVVDHAAFQRAGAIQGIGGDDVQELVGLHPLQQVADAAAFQLEHPLRLAAAKQGERLLVVAGELVRVDPLAGRLLDQIDHLREDREVAQAEEVHLQQARPLERRPCPIG